MTDRLRAPLRRLIERPAFLRFITAVIVINAVALGLETSERAMAVAGELLLAIDTACLAIFTVEIVVKLVALGPRFFRDPWNLFDFVVVGIALVPSSGSLSVLRALRVLRVLRLVSMVPSMRGVVEALLRAIPGLGSVVALLGLVFYVAAVMATKLFGATFPEWFGTIGESAYSLFQIMTLESWSHGIVRPVMEVHENAWAFFLPFILVTTFAVLNLFIAIIVNAMQQGHEAEHQAEIADATRQRQDLATSVQSLRAELAEVKALLQAERRERSEG